MFCFGIFRIFGGNRKNEENWKIWAKFGLLRRSVGNPRCGVDLRQGVGHPRRSEAEVPKWHPSGTPRRSKATPWRRPMPQRSSSSFCTPIV